jgi:hypothetical protein
MQITPGTAELPRAHQMAVTVIGPIAAQRMIAIFGRQWLIRGQ